MSYFCVFTTMKKEASLSRQPLTLSVYVAGKGESYRVNSAGPSGGVGGKSLYHTISGKMGSRDSDVGGLPPPPPARRQDEATQVRRGETLLFLKRIKGISFQTFEFMMVDFICTF